MSVAYYIVLDNDAPGFETFVNGKAVAHAADELDALCDQHALPRLDSFMGQSMDELAELLDDDLELPDDIDDQAKWFSPEDGITAVDNLIKAIQGDAGAVASANEIVDELLAYKEVLSKALGIGAKWHLALDI